jgi:hypothetical protein
MLTFDSLWVTARQPGGSLLVAEQSNLAAYAATGRRIAVVGENSAWTSWDNSILAPFGGSYSGSDTSGVLTPVLAHALTAGVSGLNTAGDGIAIGGTPLFSQNVVTLWGANAVSILSVNVLDDSTGGSNGQFKTNLANWLAAGAAAPVPEPSQGSPFWPVSRSIAPIKPESAL